MRSKNIIEVCTTEKGRMGMDWSIRQEDCLERSTTVEDEKAVFDSDTH